MKTINTLFSKRLSNKIKTITDKTQSLVLALILTAFSCMSSAGVISSMYVFGDSLSDTGALSILSPQNCPPDPYFDCRFSNGPVWAELVADELGVSAETAYSGGTNWAIGGQRTDQVKNGQVATFLTLNGNSVDSDALYVIWAGANDNFQNQPEGTYTPFAAVDNIIDSVNNLAAAGAVDFLIPNVPIADAWTLTFNAVLANALDNIMGLNIVQFDAFSTFLDITLNPNDYGFTNIDTPCFDGMSVCNNPDEYLLWDAVHPTAAGHQVIAHAAVDAMQVSSPSVIFMLIFYSIMLVVYKRIK